MQFKILYLPDKDGKYTSRNSKSSETPSLKAMLALATDCLIDSYVSPPSTSRACVFPHLIHQI